MGLDQFAFKVLRGSITQPVDFDLPQSVNPEEIHYWRKHPNLHGWMEDLYRRKKGKSDSFNCDNLELTMRDIEILEKDLNKRDLPQTNGFFFGSSNGEEIKDDLEFVKKAKAALNSGYQIYYTSWW